MSLLSCPDIPSQNMDIIKNLNIDLDAPRSEAMLTISTLPLDELLSLRKDLFDEAFFAPMEMSWFPGETLISNL
jgi:hypothetical protein